MITAVLSSFLLVAVSEMGDKTQLLAFSLAARFKAPWTVMAGILAATIVNHGLASTFGAWIARQVSPDVMTMVLAATFIGFGFWTLRADSFDESESKSRFGVFTTTAVLFFLAEMGDKTQLATVALAAKYKSAVLVTIGTTFGMMWTDGLAVFLGERIAHKVRTKWIRYAAASLFFLFAIATVWYRML